MSKFETVFNLCGSAAAAFFCAAFGGWDVWLRALLTVIVIDYLTGVVGAVVQGDLDSRVGYKGICKKMMMLCVVAMAVQADNVIGTLFSSVASDAARLMAVVVFPTPPFWLAIAMIFPIEVC